MVTSWLSSCRFKRGSEVELLEDALRDVADDEHGGLPLERDVERIFFGVDGADDGFGYGVDVGELFASLHAGGHGGLNRAGFDAQDSDAFAVYAIAEAS